MQLASLTDGLSFPALAFISMPGGYEWIIIGALGLLIFGKRLPGAARGIGQSILEFKKGMKTGEQDAESPAEETAQQIGDPAAAPQVRFDPETGKPLSPDRTATA